MRNLNRYLLSFIKLSAMGCFSLVVLSIIGITGFIGYQRVVGRDNEAEYSLNNVRCIEIANQAQVFYNSSGLELPSNAQIIKSCDDHGGFHGDGEYYVVFNTSKEEIDKYFQTNPWDSQWQKQPVPKDISSRTGLTEAYADIFESSDIWYIATGEDGAIPYHNGKLMVVDLIKNRVFYSQWDF